MIFSYLTQVFIIGWLKPVAPLVGFTDKPLSMDFGRNFPLGAMLFTVRFNRRCCTMEVSWRSLVLPYRSAPLFLFQSDFRFIFFCFHASKLPRLLSFIFRRILPVANLHLDYDLLDFCPQIGSKNITSSELTSLPRVTLITEAVGRYLEVRFLFLTFQRWQ